MPLTRDLLQSSLKEEKKKHQVSESRFLLHGCETSSGWYKITIAFNHAQAVSPGEGCSAVLYQPEVEKPGPQKAAHLEETNTNNLYNFLSSCFSQKALSRSVTLQR